MFITKILEPIQQNLMQEKEVLHSAIQRQFTQSIQQIFQASTTAFSSSYNDKETEADQTVLESLASKAAIFPKLLNLEKIQQELSSKITEIKASTATRKRGDQQAVQTPTQEAAAATVALILNAAEIAARQQTTPATKQEETLAVLGLLFEGAGNRLEAKKDAERPGVRKYLTQLYKNSAARALTPELKAALQALNDQGVTSDELLGLDDKAPANGAAQALALLSEAAREQDPILLTFLEEVKAEQEKEALERLQKALDEGIDFNPKTEADSTGDFPFPILTSEEKTEIIDRTLQLLKGMTPEQKEHYLKNVKIFLPTAENLTTEFIQELYTKIPGLFQIENGVLNLTKFANLKMSQLKAFNPIIDEITSKRAATKFQLPESLFKAENGIVDLTQFVGQMDGAQIVDQIKHAISSSATRDQLVRIKIPEGYSHHITREVQEELLKTAGPSFILQVGDKPTLYIKNTEVELKSLLQGAVNKGELSDIKQISNSVSDTDHAIVANQVRRAPLVYGENLRVNCSNNTVVDTRSQSTAR